MRIRLHDRYSGRRLQDIAGGWTGPDAAGLSRLVDGLAKGPLDPADAGPHQSDRLAQLARGGYLVFYDERLGDEVTLVPNRWDFDPAIGEPSPGFYRMARLAYVHAEDGAFHLRHPASDCFIRASTPSGLQALAAFGRPSALSAMASDQSRAVTALLARAGVIQSCDEDGLTDDDRLPARRPWDLHDAIFQSRSRLGRTERPVGATWRFKGDLEQAPAIKSHPWTERTVELPRLDLDALSRSDMPLNAAMDRRRSVRHNAVVPLTADELGTFLFRTCRVRASYTTADGSFTTRPYPGGGGLYEAEIYVTIDRCIGLPRGFFYYDASRHSLCPISEPDHNFEALLEEARMATAGICRPQILLTIASRHNRVAWKYSGISIATQLKNVGVIYQTMYLVATAMSLGGCALGLGNNDRFLAMTGLDWFEEGSLGEFILGRPL